MPNAPPASVPPLAAYAGSQGMGNPSQSQRFTSEDRTEKQCSSYQSSAPA
jgi:hypothetical protein